jgi:nitronate monooxygenase
MRMPEQTALGRAQAFCDAFNVRVPILMAPMAGACPSSLAIAVASAGGLGGCGALLMQPDTIRKWAADVRAGTNGGFQLNLWIPDPPPERDAAAEAAVRRFLNQWGPEVPAAAADATPPDFEAQCDAMLAAGPAIVSSIMGLYPDRFVARLKDKGIKWFATATTVAEAKAAEAAGADAIVAQGMEAGGHRGAFEADKAEARMVGLFSLLPAVVDAVRLPVVATGGIADGRGAAAALILGASAVQIGTALLRCPEAKIAPAWADAIGRAAPEGTMVTRAFSGRSGRSLATAYVEAAAQKAAPPPAPYPVQRGLTAAMREAAQKENDIDRIQAWAGQSAGLARAEPAGDVVRRIWAETQALLG